MAASAQEDYLAGDKLDDLFQLLDGGFLDDDAIFNADVNAVVTEVMDNEKNKAVYRCQHCEIICKSQRGLTRHCNVKHTSATITTNSCDSSISIPQLSKEEQCLKKFHPLTLKLIVNKCADSCFKDLCLPENIRCLFSKENFLFSTDDAIELWNKFRPMIEKYSGDAEDFYMYFYGMLKENILPSKFEETRFSNILLAEVANHMLTHLSGIGKDTPKDLQVAEISEKELKSLDYLGGYILHKLHSRFRFSKATLTNRTQFIALLQACKVDSDDSQTYINIRDRGGLWRVNKKMQAVFVKCEQIFRLSTINFQTKLVCHNIVHKMLENPSILSNFKSACYEVEPQVDEEVSLNLLEHMLTLFTKVRTFSYAKDIREKHKAAKQNSKKRALRVELKKTANTKELGH